MDFSDNSDIPGDLRDQMRAQFLRNKERQRLRENNEEIRQLEKHLRAAYMVRELEQQKAALEKKKEEDKREKELENIELEAQRQLALKELQQKELEEVRKKELFRESLDSQVSEMRLKRQQIMAEMTKEQVEMELLLERLKLEQERERLESEQRKENIREEIQTSIKIKELYAIEKRKQDEEEHAKALRIQQQQDENRRQLEQWRQAERAKQIALSEQIGLQLHKMELERQRREKVLLELLVQERKAKEDFQYRLNLERQVLKKDTVKRELEHYIHENRERKEAERRRLLEDERAELQKMISEARESTLLAEQRLKTKVREYSESIHEILEQRKQQRMAEAQIKLRDHDLLRLEEEKIQREIDEERLRILQCHSSEILRYLPASLFKDTDRQFLALSP